MLTPARLDARRRHLGVRMLEKLRQKCADYGCAQVAAIIVLMMGAAYVFGWLAGAW